MTIYARLFWISIVWICWLLCACGKKTRTANMNDLSISTPIRLNQIHKSGNQFFIVGGDRYKSAAIFRLDAQLSATSIPLPTNATQKEIYGLDVSSSGEILAVGYDGSIYHSPNGIDWDFVQDNSWREFQRVSFTTADSAIIVGGVDFEQGIIVQCAANGSSHLNLRQERNFEICDIQFVTPTIGYLSGYGALMKTINAGQTWTFTPAKNDYFKAMSWSTPTDGIVIGYNGSILQTTDGGEQWTTIRNGNDLWKPKWHLLDIAHNQFQTYVAVGEKGLLILSTDHGTTWHSIPTHTTYDIRGVEFIDANRCLVVGEQGLLLEVTLP